jgi:hypothetical protein
MSLPPKNEKGYLEITDRPDGFSITARKEHANDLAPLFRQHGLACRREEGAEQDTLVFDAGTDRAKVEEVLTGYGEAKGS